MGDLLVPEVVDELIRGVLGRDGCAGLAASCAWRSASTSSSSTPACGFVGCALAAGFGCCEGGPAPGSSTPNWSSSASRSSAPLRAISWEGLRRVMIAALLVVGVRCLYVTLWKRGVPDQDADPTEAGTMLSLLEDDAAQQGLVGREASFVGKGQACASDCPKLLRARRFHSKVQSNPLQWSSSPSLDNAFTQSDPSRIYRV